jgi:hypothetical protein
MPTKLSSDWKRYGAGAAVVASGLLSDYAINALMRRGADRSASRVGPASAEDQEALLGLAGNPYTKHVPAIPSPAYISGRDIAYRQGRKPPKQEKQRKGVIAYDSTNTPLAYLAHEAGHAAAPRALRTDNVSPTTHKALALTSLVPGVAYGALTGNVGRAAIVGAAARLLGQSPTILEEYFAMRRGKQLINAMNKPEAEKDLHRQALNRAFATYLTPIISGGAMGAASAMAGRVYRGAQ